jgi:hypothetical protein
LWGGTANGSREAREEELEGCLKRPTQKKASRSSREIFSPIKTTRVVWHSAAWFNINLSGYVLLAFTASSQINTVYAGHN